MAVASRVSESAPALRESLIAAGEEARARLEMSEPRLDYELDLRYLGQSYELTVGLEGSPDGELAATLDVDAPRATFDELHEARFAHHDAEVAVEVVNVRVTARVPGADIDPVPEPAVDATETTTADVWFSGEQLATQFVDRAGLVPGDRIDGPAVVTQLDSTTLIPPGWHTSVDQRLNLLLERS